MSLLVCVLLLNGNKCQDNEGNCQAGTKCTPTVHTYMENTARKVLDQMFEDKMAAVESRFNDLKEETAELKEETTELKEMLRLKDEKINQLEVSTKLSIMEEKIKLHT